MKYATILLGLLNSLVMLCSCAQILVPGTLAGAGEYMRYTSTNVPKRTFMGNQQEVSAATIKALKIMNIRAPSEHSVRAGRPITATTAELTISIMLEPVTPTTTRVTVDAARGQVVKDKATADKILDQIEAQLSDENDGGNTLSLISIRNNCDKPIDVAIHYLNGEDAAGKWQSDGWFRLAPGEKRSVVSTAGRYIYFYAVSPADNGAEWGGKFFQNLQGGRYGFFKVDLGVGTVDFTQSFNCN